MLPMQFKQHLSNHRRHFNWWLFFYSMFQRKYIFIFTFTNWFLFSIKILKGVCTVYVLGMSILVPSYLLSVIIALTRFLLLIKPWLMNMIFVENQSRNLIRAMLLSAHKMEPDTKITEQKYIEPTAILISC